MTFMVQLLSHFEFVVENEKSSRPFIYFKYFYLFLYLAALGLHCSVCVL